VKPGRGRVRVDEAEVSPRLNPFPMGYRTALQPALLPVRARTMAGTTKTTRRAESLLAFDAVEEIVLSRDHQYFVGRDWRRSAPGAATRGIPAVQCMISAPRRDPTGVPSARI